MERPLAALGPRPSPTVAAIVALTYHESADIGEIIRGGLSSVEAAQRLATTFTK